MPAKLTEKTSDLDVVFAQLLTVCGSEEEARSELRRLEALAQANSFEGTDLMLACIRLRASGLDFSDASLKVLMKHAGLEQTSATSLVQTAQDLTRGFEPPPGELGQALIFIARSRLPLDKVLSKCR